jgi:UPF0271 protein
MISSIDLNSDLGESFGPWNMGDDPAMLSIVNSANVACGGHASDPETMYQTVKLAVERGVVVGAHPGYNDREGFGRRIIPMTEGEIERLIVTQVGALMGVAALAGTSVRYVKPHGALGNLASADRAVADAIVRAIKAISPDMAVLAISGTELEIASKDMGLPTYSEIFADRAYQHNGQLVPRNLEGAVLHDSKEASYRLITFLETGEMPCLDGSTVRLEAQSICVHGDSPGAVEMAAHIRDCLLERKIDVRSFLDA